MPVRGPSSTVCLACAAALLALEGTAVAQSAGASELFRQGVEALREGDYPGAESAFRMSYDMEARAETQCNLALTYERWAGHDRQALEAYRRCAEDDDSGRYRRRALERSQVIRQRLEAAGEPVAEPAAAGTEPGGLEDQGGPGSGTSGGGSSSGAAGQTSRTRPEGGGRTSVELTARPLLWIGVAAGALAAGAFGTAIGLHAWTAGVHDDLQGRYDGITIPEGSDAAERVARGQSGVSAALGLYIAGGILAAASTLFVVLDVVQQAEDEGEEVEAIIAVSPGPSGLSVTASIPFD